MVYIFSIILIIVLAVIAFVIIEDRGWNKICTALLAAAILVAGQMLYTGPMYNVWAKALSGKAALAEAEWDRQIRIEEADAEYEAAKLTAKAEVERAKGADEANAIMAQSLGGNENYLRWLWIQQMPNIQEQVIYLESDAGLPILEAGRLK